MSPIEYTLRAWFAIHPNMATDDIKTNDLEKRQQKQKTREICR